MPKPLPNQQPDANLAGLVEKASRAQAEAQHQARLAQFYHQQRLNAEAAAMSGDAGARATLGKIGGKLAGSRNATQKQIGQDDLTLARGGRVADRAKAKGRTTGDAARPASVTDDPVAYLGDPAAALGGLLKRGGLSALTHAFPHVVDDAAHAVAGMFPRAEGAIERIIPGARVVGKAKVEDIPQKAIGARKALPKNASSMKNVTPKAQAKGPIRQAGEARAKRQTAVIRGAKRAKQAPGKDPVTVGSQRALPKPQKELGKDFKQPEQVKARTPRAKQTSARAKGSNPRQQPGYTRGKKAQKKDERAA